MKYKVLYLSEALSIVYKEIHKWDIHKNTVFYCEIDKCTISYNSLFEILGLFNFNYDILRDEIYYFFEPKWFIPFINKNKIETVLSFYKLPIPWRDSLIMLNYLHIYKAIWDIENIIGINEFDRNWNDCVLLYTFTDKDFYPHIIKNKFNSFLSNMCISPVDDLLYNKII